MAAASIKLRTELRKGALTVRALIRHPMEIGRKLDDGTRLKPHFITRVVCRLGEDVVLDADWGGGIAKNPYLSFIVDGVETGTRLTLAWSDNQGGHDELVVDI
ncbi:MAG TPA: thiosulfate oxidation carrier complex protein SoxZ [Gammaproteobacteria bacterium]|nr:thiosulfate oxidation carrier complex protein SoxZ [Gammaproteobacteria bacterium]